jgi:hypothetical protein
MNREEMKKLMIEYNIEKGRFEINDFFEWIQCRMILPYDEFMEFMNMENPDNLQMLNEILFECAKPMK